MSEVKLSKQQYKAYKPKRGPNWKLILGGVLLAVLAIFAFINRDAVAVNFLFAKVSLPLILIILAAFFLGVVVALLIQSFRKPS